MKITKITYQKAFWIGSYLQEKIGGEISLDEGEDAMEALNTLRDFCNAAHKPLQEGDSVFKLPEISKELTTDHFEIPEPIPKTKEQQKANILKLISTCNDKKNLESMFLISKADPELLSAYNKKMEEFA